MAGARPKSWLAHLRVLQADQHLVTSYAGYVLSQLGADVEVAGEPGAGSFEGPEELRRLMNGGRRIADWRMLERYDVAIGGPGTRGLASVASHLPVAEAVVDHGVPPGRDDVPELILEALTGFLSASRLPEAYVEPMKAGGYQILLQAGVTLAMLALAAVRARTRGGQCQHYVLSMRELGLALHNALVKVSFSAPGADIDGRGVYDSQPSLIVECSDGPIFITAVEDAQFRSLCEIIGQPELADLPEVATRLARAEHHEALHIIIRDALAGRSRADIESACTARGIPAPLYHRPNDLLSSAQLSARHFWTHQVLDGQRVQAPAVPWTVAPGAPRKGGASAPPMRDATPLDDVLITETSWVWAGPFASLLLAYLGAAVIHIESAQHLDLFRRTQALPLPPPDRRVTLNTGPSFNQLNLGKQGIVMDLGSTEDRALLRRMLDHSDLFLSNFRPGTLARLGLGDEVLAGIPGLITGRISGYGPEAPWGDRVLYGFGAVMAGGLGAYSGPEGAPPTPMGFAYGDCASGNWTALAAVAALVRRDHAGDGAIIDVSIFEAIACQVTDAIIEHELTGGLTRRGNRHHRFAPQGVYRCAGEDAWVALAVRSNDQWAVLANLIGAPDIAHWSEQQRHAGADTIDAQLEGWAAGRTAPAAEEQLQALGIASASMRTPGDIFRELEHSASGYLTQMEHPEVGPRLLALAPWTVNGKRLPIRRAPLFGEHTDVLRAAFAAPTSTPGPAALDAMHGGPPALEEAAP